MSSIQGQRQTQENSLPNKKKLIKRNVNSQLLKDKLAYFDIQTPNMKFASLFEETTDLLNEIVKNQNIQNDILNQTLQEIEKKIKTMYSERSRVQKEFSEFAFGHILHMIDIYQNSDDLNHKYVSFYLMKVWIKNFQYSEQYIDMMLSSIDDNLSFQKEIFSFLQELSIEKPDVLDKILKIANSITSNFQGLINQDSEENQQQKKSVSSLNKGKSQEEFLEFILNILQKFESQELEKQLINIIQKYVPQNSQQYHKIILENFLNSDEIYEKYFSICIELIKKGFDEQDIQIVLQYIKKAEQFYLKIKNSNRRGEFIKLLISNVLFLRQTKKQELVKPVRNLWKPTIFSDKEGQEKILEHQEEIISYLCSKFTSGDEETLTMATDGFLEILDKVIKDSTELQNAPNNKKINYLQQLFSGCLNNMYNQEKYFQLLAKFTNLLGQRSTWLQIQALVRLEWKYAANLDINSINDYYQKQQTDLKAELLKLRQFTAASFFLFILNKKVMSKEIEQTFNQVENKTFALYKMNHNILHGFLLQYFENPQSKAILESCINHYFKLERTSQLKELEKYYGQDYIKNLITSYKGEDQANVNYQTYLQQTSATSQNTLANNQQQQEDKEKTTSFKEYAFVSFDQKRQMFSNLNISPASLIPESKEDTNQMEIEEITKQSQVQEKQNQQLPNHSNKTKITNNQKQNQQGQEVSNTQKNQQKNNQTQNQNTQAVLKINLNSKNQQKVKTPTKQPQQDSDNQTKEQNLQNQQKAQQNNEVQEQPKQFQEVMQIENAEVKQNSAQTKQQEEKQDLVIEKESQIDVENQQQQEQVIEQKQQKLQEELQQTQQKEEIKIKSSQALEINNQESKQSPAQEEKQQSQQEQNVVEVSEKQETMEIEENNNLQEQKKQQVLQPKPIDLSSSQTPTTPKIQLPSLQIKKPSLQANTPQNNQQQQVSKPTLATSKQPQLIQESVLTESKDIQNTDQNNQKPSLPLNVPKPSLSMKEKALLMMKGKPEAQKQNTIQTPQQQKEQSNQAQPEVSQEVPNKPAISIPTLGLKQLSQQKQTDQQVKSTESLEKQPSDNKPSIDLAKKPSLLMMKKKQEQSNPSTPSNTVNLSTTTAEQIEVEQKQVVQSTESLQNQEKNQQKPALSLKPKIQIKSLDKLSEIKEQNIKKVELDLKKEEKIEQSEIVSSQTVEEKQEQIPLDNNISEKLKQEDENKNIGEKLAIVENSTEVNQQEQIEVENNLESKEEQQVDLVNKQQEEMLEKEEEKIQENNTSANNEEITELVEEKQAIEIEEEVQQTQTQQLDENIQFEKKEEEAVQNGGVEEETIKENQEEVLQNQTEEQNQIELENQEEEDSSLKNKELQDQNAEIEANDVIVENQDVINNIEEEEQQATISQANQDEDLQEEGEAFMVVDDQVQDDNQQLTQNSQQQNKQENENEQENVEQLEQQVDGQDQVEVDMNQQEEIEQTNTDQINEETKELNEETQEVKEEKGEEINQI